jgi:ribosomal protein S18 acetylase RimI-like enzyme
MTVADSAVEFWIARKRGDGEAIRKSMSDIPGQLPTWLSWDRVLEAATGAMSHAPYPAPNIQTLTRYGLFAVLVVSGVGNAKEVSTATPPIVAYAVAGPTAALTGCVEVSDVVIMSVCVHPDWRRQGLARQLVQHVVRLASSEVSAAMSRLSSGPGLSTASATSAGVNLRTVRVQTMASAKANEPSPAMRLYESLGFRARRTIARYYKHRPPTDETLGQDLVRDDRVSPSVPCTDAVELVLAVEPKRCRPGP